MSSKPNIKNIVTIAQRQGPSIDDVLEISDNTTVCEGEEAPTQEMDQQIILDTILEKPKGEEEKKAHVREVYSQLVKRFSHIYKRIDYVYHNFDQHTFVIVGDKRSGNAEAIKVFPRAPWFGRKEYERRRKRFLCEIDLLDGLHRILNGQNIVKVLDYGKGILRGKTPFNYFTSPYEQRTLRDIPSTHPIKKLINIHRQIAEVLAFVHESYHVIHRDLKPSNIAIDVNDNPLLLDFGAMEVMKIEDEKMGKNKKMRKKFSEIVSIPYASPMQCRNKLDMLQKKHPAWLDYSADVYSLGTMLANTLFKGHPENTLEIIAKRFEKNPHLFFKSIVLGPEIKFPSTGNRDIDAFIYRSRTQGKDKYASMYEAAHALAAIEADLID